MTDCCGRLRELKTRQAGEAPEVEPELLLHGPQPVQMVSRLEESTPKFQEVDVDAYRPRAAVCPCVVFLSWRAKSSLSGLAEASYAISGGTGGLGLLFAAWFAEKGAGHLALLSRSGKIAQDRRCLRLSWG